MFSDHNPSTFLTEAAPKSSKLTRWALALQEYNLELSFRAVVEMPQLTIYPVSKLYQRHFDCNGMWPVKQGVLPVSRLFYMCVIFVKLSVSILLL